MIVNDISLVAAIGALLGFGGMLQKVERHEKKLDTLDKEKVDKETFEQVLKRLDDVHLDVREIRDRIRNGHA